MRPCDMTLSLAVVIFAGIIILVRIISYISDIWLFVYLLLLVLFAQPISWLLEAGVSVAKYKVLRKLRST